MSTYSAQKLHNKDLFSKCSYYSKNFHWTYESQEETAEQKPRRWCWNQTEECLKRDLPKPITTGAHPKWVTFESSLSGTQTCASTNIHTLQPPHCCPSQLPFHSQFLGCTAMEVICILTVFCNSVHKYAHCMFIAPGLIRTGCSCPAQQGDVYVQGSDNTKTCLEPLSQEVPASINNSFTV